MKTIIRLILILPLLFIFGCMSIAGTFDENESKVYIGARADLVMATHLVGDEPAWGMIGVIDLPLSVAMDTVLLPYTIPHDIMQLGDDE